MFQQPKAARGATLCHRSPIVEEQSVKVDGEIAVKRVDQLAEEVGSGLHRQSGGLRRQGSGLLWQQDLVSAKKTKRSGLTFTALSSSYPLCTNSQRHSTSPSMSPVSDNSDDPSDNLPEKTRALYIALSDRVEWGWANLSVKVLLRKHTRGGGFEHLAYHISDYVSRRDQSKDVPLLLDSATELVHSLPFSTIRRIPDVLKTMDITRLAHVKAAAQLLLETTCRRYYTSNFATWQDSMLRYVWYEAQDDCRALFTVVRDILSLDCKAKIKDVVNGIAAKLVKEYGPPQSWFSSRDMLARRHAEGAKPFTTHDALVIVLHAHSLGSSIDPASHSTYDDYLLDPYTLARIRALAIQTEADRRRGTEKDRLGAGGASLWLRARGI